MARWFAAPLLTAAVVGLAVLAPPAPGRAQPPVAPPPANQNVGEAEEFKTADGVQLKGRFFKSNKAGVTATEAPVVVLLYAPGPDKNMTKGDWAGLANKLTENGFNVFQFDWRGHGQSTALSDANKFWGVPLPSTPPGTENLITGPIHQNGRYMSGFNRVRLKTTIDVKDFKPGYWPVLVNDLAAVRCHLDAKNDRGTINTSRIYLIGEKGAAALGMMWMAAEYTRHDANVLDGVPQVAYTTVPLPPAVQQYAAKPLEVRAANDVRGAIWLSPSLQLGVSEMQLVNLFKADIAPGLRQTPMCFIYGADDAIAKGAKGVSWFIDSVLHVNPKKLGNLPPVPGTKVAVIDKTKAAGVALLGAGGAAEERIVAYLNEILPKEQAATKQRKFTAPYYIDLGYFGFRF